VAARRDQAQAGWRVRRHRAALARRFAAALLLNALIEPVAASAASPSGSQFQVNSYTTNYQVEARVASDSAGNFVVVWTSYGDPAYSIQGQRYAASGSAIGGQFQVSTPSPDSQQSPSIASDAAGEFIVVWQSNGSSGSGSSVQGQRYDASGSPIDGEFQVDSYTTGSQDRPSVASDSTGDFVVVWESAGSLGSDTSDHSVQGQRYDASGSPIGGEFQINNYTTGSQDHASVASDSAGNFVVVWQSAGSSGADVSGTSVQGQRYDASGSAVGGEFQVNSYTTGRQARPSVASDSAGNFVVVWQSIGSAGNDTSGLSVQGQRYAAGGSKIGGEFQVNTYTTSNQSGPSIASDSAGNFVVVWESYGSAGSDTSAWSVHGRSYGASGSPTSAEFQVNSYTTDDQFIAAVASNSAGTKFVVVWESNGSAGSDTSNSSVQGQRYLPEPAFAPSLGAMLGMVIALARRRRRI
jgi:hypothetical protein